ncbi:Glycerol-3-phosphate acyltransferase [Desulfovibrio sp. X2]|uniref:glycerol-3-phosphate 1-O-acyltransferase PlsY n=1 Tax=Desulfovibrio sp. X2 TaxID=941449 RepID=UPI000358A55A|nr:glycerol-3-phosphate 1-O-acyltransferase PlsY [Desulfovibrio sp. X2]EPR44295.1 Glycerol-3-phosphate acyltransferase [Desulfovibrio sp. X2]
MILNFGWLIMTYVLGSIPFGLFIAKMVCGIDPREHGSRNIGATNVARLCGTRYGVAALALDLLKGFLPVWAATRFSHGWFFLSLCALAAVVGHMYSCFLGGRGGKGFATTIGAFLALAPWTVILSVALCIATIASSGFVSLGALVFGAALPLLLLLGGSFGFVPAGLVAMTLLYWKHRENIVRLARGEENPWRRGKTVATEDVEG